MRKRSSQKPAPRLSLKDLDKNFRPETGSDGLVWHDAFDPRLTLCGLGWPKENFRARNFRRFPDRVESRLSGGVNVLSHCPAGVYLSFMTDSPDLSVRVELPDLDWMDHMPPTGTAGTELFVRRDSHWHTVATSKPSLTEHCVTRALLTGAPRELREYRLYFPLYKRVNSVAVGFSPSAKIAPPPAPHHPKPLVVYGTSITQGGCANTAGSDFVSTLGRLLDRETLNFGFSGSGRGERQIAEILSELTPEAYVLDYVANADSSILRKTLAPFVGALRAAHPRIPILLVGMVPFDQILWNTERRKVLDERRDILMKFYLTRKAAGDENIHFIDGHGLLPIGQSGIYVDGVHPTSYGFAVMAERLAPQIRSILDRPL